MIKEIYVQVPLSTTWNSRCRSVKKTLVCMYVLSFWNCKGSTHCLLCLYHAVAVYYTPFATKWQCSNNLTKPRALTYLQIHSTCGQTRHCTEQHRTETVNDMKKERDWTNTNKNKTKSRVVIHIHNNNKLLLPAKQCLSSPEFYALSRSLLQFPCK